MGHNFQELMVWQKSAEFYTQLIYLLKNFPDYEKNCLVPQITRATLSISNNIAEGSGRQSDKNLIYFLYIALGSSKEVESMLAISKKLNYLNEFEFNQLNLKLDEIEKMLFGLIKTINSSKNIY